MVMSNVKSFIEDESGATAIEYGLIAVMIAVAIIPAVETIAPKLGITFGNVGAKL